MPSWPGSIFAPTVKSAGQTIQAAHVNDLQDEVVAVETGYSTGTAPLHSSNSTVVTLTVVGAANLTRLDISGGSTLSQLSVNAGSTFMVRPVTPPPHLARVSGSTTELASNSTVAATWPTQDILTNSSIHSTSANAERLVPQSTGVWAMHVSLALNGGFTAGSTMRFLGRIEDSSGARLDEIVVGPPGDGVVSLKLFAAKRFDVLGGHLQVMTAQRSGSTNSLFSAAGFNTCHFYKL